MRLLSMCCALVLVACSDDAIPADTEAGSTGTMMTMTSQSPTGPSSGDTLPPGSLTDASTTSDDEGTTAVGSESTFGGSESGDSDTPTGSGTTEPMTGSTTEPGTGTGSDGTGSTGAEETTGADPGNVGDECMSDMDCDSGICWSWNDFDPFCYLELCSLSCMGDDECVAAFEEAGAPYPENVFCSDGVCWPLESGLGSPICE